MRTEKTIGDETGWVKKQAKGNLLPFSLVEQAASGDIEAIDRVLRHYAGYIRTLAICVDEEMCKRLEIKLITRILHFRVIPVK